MPKTSAARKTVSRHGWLSWTPERFRNSVLKRCVFQMLGAGQTVYNAGDAPGGIFGLVSGGLRVRLAPAERPAFNVHMFVPGSWTGEAAALSGKPRLATVSTTRETQLLHLPSAAVNAILLEDSGSVKSFAMLTHWHLETALGVIGDLMLRDPRQRIISALLRLSGCRQETPTGLGVVELDLVQDDLAIMSNVGRTTVNTLLRELQAKHQIEISYRRIRVTAPDELRSMLLSGFPRR